MSSIVSISIKIFFFASLLTLIPLIQPAQEIIVVQDTPTSMVLRITQPEIELSSDANSQIVLNITRITTSGVEEVITVEFYAFQGSDIIKIPKPGTYLFEMQTNEFSTVTVNGKGIFISHLAIFILSILLNIGIVTRDYLINYSI